MGNKASKRRGKRRRFFPSSNRASHSPHQSHDATADDEDIIGQAVAGGEEERLGGGEGGENSLLRENKNNETILFATPATLSSPSSMPKKIRRRGSSLVESVSHIDNSDDCGFGVIVHEQSTALCAAGKRGVDEESESVSVLDGMNGGGERSPLLHHGNVPQAVLIPIHEEKGDGELHRSWVRREDREDQTTYFSSFFPTPTEKTRDLRWFQLSILLLIDVLGPFSSSSYIPNLPQIKREFQSDEMVVNLTLQFNWIAKAIGTLFPPLLLSLSFFFSLSFFLFFVLFLTSFSLSLSLSFCEQFHDRQCDLGEC